MKNYIRNAACIVLTVIIFSFGLSFSACTSEETDYTYTTEDLSELSSAELEATADYNVFYKPENGRVGDVMPYYEDGVYYLYYLMDGSGSSSHPAYMVSTTDFINYTEYGLVLEAGASNANDAMIGTGSIVEHNGEYLFFYTGHPSSGDEVLLLAVSDNKTDFEKQTDFEVQPSDYGFTGDFRDPDVAFNEETEVFDVIVSTRLNEMAVLALFHVSEDFSEISYDKILYEDTHGFNVLECPSAFEMEGKWYITYSAQDLSLSGSTGDAANNSLTLTGNKGSMYYLVSESKFGTYREMADPMLDSVVYYAGKVAAGNETMLVGWAAERSTNLGYEYNWGGNLVAHVITKNADGTLALSYPDAYAEYFNTKIPILAEDSFSLVASSGTFTDLADEVQEYRLSMKISFTSDTKSFGFVFGLASDMDNVVKVTIDPVNGKIKAQYGSNGEMASRYIALDSGTEYQVDIFAEGSNYVLYIHDTPFTFKIRNTGNKKIAVFAKEGIVNYSDIVMYAPGGGEVTSGLLKLDADETKIFSVTADADSYLSGFVCLYAEKSVKVEIIANGKELDSSESSGFIELNAYANVKAGKTLTVSITSESETTVFGLVRTSQSYYVPGRAEIASREKSNGGAEISVSEGGGYLYFAALAVQAVSADGRLILTKNGEEIADINVADGLARISGGVYADTGDVFAASIDYDGTVSSYDCRLSLYSGEYTESNLAVNGTDREYSHDLGVEISDDRSDNASVAGSFGVQGTDGFVYTYGESIDEMNAISVFNTNSEYEYNYKYTESSVASEIEVKADWMKTGSHYMTGVTYVVAGDGTINVSLSVTPTEADGGYILVQIYQNHYRLEETILEVDGEGDTYTFTAEIAVESDDQIIFGLKNVGAYTDSGAAAANYTYEISQADDSDDTDTSVNEIANFAEDFSLEQNPNNGWGYGSVSYSWDASQTIVNDDKTESFTYEKSTETSSDAWLSGDMEIKSNWINTSGTATITYTFESAGETVFDMWVYGAQEYSILSIRYVLIDEDGNILEWEFVNYGTREWSLNTTINVTEGSTIYIIFFNETTVEENYPQAYFSISFYQ